MGKVSVCFCFFLSVLNERWRMSPWGEECGSVEKKVKKGSTRYKGSVIMRVLLLKAAFVMMVLQFEAEKVDCLDWLGSLERAARV